jgi:hypothetical protein
MSRKPPAAAAGILVGRDFAAPRGTRARTRGLLPLALATALSAALSIAALRVDLIRVRYGLADALGAEKVLLQERREALAALSARRDPARLAPLAKKRGLVRPSRILELPAAGGGRP